MSVKVQEKNSTGAKSRAHVFHADRRQAEMLKPARVMSAEIVREGKGGGLGSRRSFK